MKPLAGQLIFRKAIEQDAGAVRKLTRAAYARWVDVIGREPLPMTADYDVAVRDHLIDLAYLGTELAGLIEMIVKPDHLFIENVAVAPAFQGRGLGSRLMAQAEVRCLEHEFAVLKLLTNSKFVSNVRFYEHLGYKTDRIEPFRDGHTTYMSKMLSA